MLPVMRSAESALTRALIDKSEPMTSFSLAMAELRGRDLYGL
jgi:hypothetical protein